MGMAKFREENLEIPIRPSLGVFAGSMIVSTNPVESTKI